MPAWRPIRRPRPEARPLPRGWPAQPSRRLIGDYLAIVTLFFGEAFVEFTNNVAPSVLGGPNGIVGIDTVHAFRYRLSSTASYYYLLIVVLLVRPSGLFGRAQLQKV